MHGLTVNEAKEAVQEAVSDYLRQRKFGKIKVITGLGNHSKGGVGKLGPSMRAYLMQLGWRVESGDAGRGWFYALKPG